MSQAAVRGVVISVVVASLAGVFGCQSDENTLSGSASRIYDLSFQTVRARLYSSEFSIEYVREDGQIPVQVVVDRSDKKNRQLSAGSINLDEHGSVIGRVDSRSLPDFKTGTLELDKFGTTPRDRIAGSFQAQLRSRDSVYTLKGKFSTRLDVIDGTLGYRYPDVGDAGREDASGGSE